MATNLLIPNKYGFTPDRYKIDMQALEVWARQPIQQLIAGSGITLSPATGLATDSKGTGPHPITISASGGGAGGCLAPVVVINNNPNETISNPPSGAATIDGHAVVTGERVLVTQLGGGTSVNNGIWVANTAGAWTRPSDWANGATIPDGTVIPVHFFEGSNYFSSLWILCVEVAGSLIVGTTSLFFFQGIGAIPGFVTGLFSQPTPNNAILDYSQFTEPYALKVKSTSGAYQMSGNEPVVIGNGAITLPDAASSGLNQVFTIKDSGAGTMSIHPHGANTIDGSAAAITPGAFGFRHLIEQSSNWLTI